MKKILILKNDRVGDFFNSVKGINSILNEHSDYEINIFLSNYSKDLSFLFDLKNVKVKIINYNLNIKEKIYIAKKVIFEKYKKIYILSPKNFYFYLPLISNSKFYAICIKEKNKVRPPNFLIKKLHSYVINDRTSKKIGESIANLIEKISNKKKIQYSNILNNNPVISKSLNDNLIYFKNFIHIHYKHILFKKNGWKLNDFIDLINKIAEKGHKVFLTSDYCNSEYNSFFLKKFSYIDFENQKINISNKNLVYLHNIQIKYEH